jgi:hypothetical protein
MKEIGASCRLLNPSAITLEPAEDAAHFEIHVKDSVSDKNWQCLRDVAKRNGLGIKLTNEILIIYKPTNKKNGKLIHV